MPSITSFNDPPLLRSRELSFGYIGTEYSELQLTKPEIEFSAGDVKL